MNLNKAGKIMLAVGLVASLLWANAVPKVIHGTDGAMASCVRDFEEDNRCVFATGPIALRFVMGTAVSFVLALATTAMVKQEEDT